MFKRTHYLEIAMHRLLRYACCMKKISTSFRLSAEAIRLLKALSEKYGGVGQAALIEVIVREKAKSENIK